MPNRRTGVSGSFGAPLEQIVASFPEGDAPGVGASADAAIPASPGLSREDVAASLRSAFTLNDLL